MSISQLSALIFPHRILPGRAIVVSKADVTFAAFDGKQNKTLAIAGKLAGTSEQAAVPSLILTAFATGQIQS